MSKSATLREMQKKVIEGKRNRTLDLGKYEGLKITDEALAEVVALGKSDEDQGCEEDDISTQAKTQENNSGPSTPVIKEKEQEVVKQSDPFIPSSRIVSQINFIMTKEEENALEKAKAIIPFSSSEEISAFLHGFRTKQDFINVTLGKQIRDLENSTGKIGSLVSALASTVSNLSTGVAQVLGKLSEAVDAIAENQQRMMQSYTPNEAKVRTENWVASTSKTPDVIMTSTLPSIPTRPPIQYMGKMPERDLTEIIDENRSITENAVVAEEWDNRDIEGVLGLKIEEILGHYEISEEELRKILLVFGRSLATAQKDHGALLKARILSKLA